MRFGTPVGARHQASERGSDLDSWWERTLRAGVRWWWWVRRWWCGGRRRYLAVEEVRVRVGEEEGGEAAPSVGWEAVEVRRLNLAIRWGHQV